MLLSAVPGAWAQATTLSFTPAETALLVAAYLTHTVVAQLSLGLATPRPVELDPAVASELDKIPALRIRLLVVSPEDSKYSV